MEFGGNVRCFESDVCIQSLQYSRLLRAASAVKCSSRRKSRKRARVFERIMILIYKFYTNNEKVQSKYEIAKCVCSYFTNKYREEGKDQANDNVQITSLHDI